MADKRLVEFSEEAYLMAQVMWDRMQNIDRTLPHLGCLILFAMEKRMDPSADTLALTQRVGEENRSDFEGFDPSEFTTLTFLFDLFERKAGTLHTREQLAAIDPILDDIAPRDSRPGFLLWAVCMIYLSYSSRLFDERKTEELHHKIIEQAARHDRTGFAPAPEKPAVPQYVVRSIGERSFNDDPTDYSSEHGCLLPLVLFLGPPLLYFALT